MHADAPSMSRAGSDADGRVPVWRRAAVMRSVGAVLLAAVTAWVIVRAVTVGRRLQQTDPEIFLGAAPLVGRNFRDGWDWRFGWALVAAAAVALAVVALVVTGWWSRASLRLAAAASGLSAAMFAVLLALLDGTDGLTYPVVDKTEYLANVDRMPSIAQFIRTFVDRIDDYSVHVRGHPPGYTAIVAMLDRVGLGGPWPIVALSVLAIAITASTVTALVGEIGGLDAARRAAPFLAVAPYAVWMAISADAVFVAVGALGTWLLIRAMSGSAHAASSAIGAGVLLGVLPFVTYLGAVFMVIPMALVIRPWRRDRRCCGRPLVIAIAVAGLIVATWAAAGFWWFDGVEVTKREYWEGSAQFRRWNYFGYGNLAAAAIALGPASVFGIVASVRRRDQAMWWIIGAGLTALAISHLSQYTKAEVERIWLVFYPFIAIAGIGLVGEGRRGRRVGAAWLTVQAAAAIVLQAALVSKW